LAVVTRERLRRRLGHLKTLIGGDRAGDSETESATAATDLAPANRVTASWRQALGQARLIGRAG